MKFPIKKGVIYWQVASLIQKSNYSSYNIEEMRVQRYDRASHLKLKIDNHKARVVKQPDQNEKPPVIKLECLQPAKGKRTTKTLKSLDLKVEGQKHKGHIVHRNTTDYPQKQNRGQSLQTQNLLRTSFIRLRSISSNNLLPNTQNPQEKGKFRKTGFTINTAMFEQKSLQIYNHLKLKNTLLEINPDTCAVHRQDLLDLLKAFVYFRNDKNLYKLNTNLTNTKTIVQEFEKVGKIFRPQEDSDQPIDVNKLISSQDITSLEEKKKLLKMEKYDGQIKKLKNIVNELRQTEASLEEKIIEASKQMARYEAHQQKIKSMDEERQSIFNNTYGEEYKKVVEDLQDYAVYLQTTRILRAIKNEPTPFNSIQEMIEEELKTVSKLINYDNQLTPQMKVDLIRNFIKRALQKFRARDEEVKELLEFKTKCITEFVDKMKNWYNNWTFKNDYLSDLKKEFLNVEGKVENQIEILRQQCGKVDNKKEAEMQGSLNEIKNLCKKVVELYLMGHSFY